MKSQSPRRRFGSRLGLAGVVVVAAVASGCSLFGNPTYRRACALSEAEVRQIGEVVAGDLLPGYGFVMYYDECPDGRARGVWYTNPKMTDSKAGKFLNEEPSCRRIKAEVLDYVFLCSTRAGSVELQVDGPDIWIVPRN